MVDAGRVPFAALRFCGRMNAHISHDLKNVTATVSETAFLLEDLMELLTSGGDVEPARIKTLCSRIVEEVERGGALLRRMNAFAHSTDEAVKTVDLRETAELMADLASCLPFSRTVVLDSNEEPLEITTLPYMVMQYCYLVFRACFEAMKPEQTLGLGVHSLSDGCRIVIGPLPRKPEISLFDSLEAIASELGGRSSFDADTASVSLNLPASV